AGGARPAAPGSRGGGVARRLAGRGLAARGDDMNPLPDAGSPPAIHNPASWQAALSWGVATAAAREARRITWVDSDFATWPLDDAALLEALTAWLRLPQRRLVVLAHAYDDMPRRFARFTTWRRKFG